MKNILVAITFLLLPFYAHAVDCGPYSVIAIQSQHTTILVKIQDGDGAFWKKLGSHADESAKSFQAIAQQALATNSQILLRYPDGTNCSQEEYLIDPLMIRIFK